MNKFIILHLATSTSFLKIGQVRLTGTTSHLFLRYMFSFSKTHGPKKVESHGPKKIQKDYSPIKKLSLML